MELKEITGTPDYSEIIDLINTEWPPEFGEKSDSEKISEMVKSHNTKTDTVKYLYDNKMIIGFYRYSAWPRDMDTTETAHTFDIAVRPDKQKQGLETFLMKDMIEDCRKKGYKKLLSRTFRSNKGSIRLHNSTGFSLYMETEDSYVWEIVL